MRVRKSGAHLRYYFIQAHIKFELNSNTVYTSNMIVYQYARGDEHEI